MDDPPLAMGATTSASVPLPDDEACEAVLRKFIAEDLERAERLLHRAAELLGGWFTVFHEMRGVVGSNVFHVCGL